MRNARGAPRLARGWALTVVALLLAACTAATPTATPTAEPTPAPAPTATSTPVPTLAPAQPATPTPTATPTPAATPAPALTGVRHYANDLYGVEFDYPATWTGRESLVTSPILAEFGPNVPEQDAVLRLSLVYRGLDITPAESADEIVAALATRQGFRTRSEGSVALGASTGFRVAYSVGLSPNESLGSLVTTMRGSQQVVLLLEGKRAAYDANAALFESTAQSLRLVEPRPFGFPREQLLMFYSSEPQHLDPALVHTSLEAQFVGYLFDGLVTLDAQMRLVPNLAERWELSADGLTYTFHLDPDARFHDGRPVTAQDVKYSWERATDPRLRSPSAGTYLDDIVGVRERLAGTATGISGVVVVDERTLRVSVDAPKVYFLSKLTHPAASVLSRQNVERARAQDAPWWLRPVGTGPFTLSQWRTGAAMLLERSATYHREAAKSAHVAFRFYGGLPLRMYQDEEVDVVSLEGRETVETAQAATFPFRTHLASSAELSLFYVGFDTTVPPFDQPQVRRAFLLATDRKKLVEDLVGPSGVVAQGFLPPGMPGYDVSSAAIPYDPEEAHRLLKASTYGSADKLPIVVYTPGVLSEEVSVRLLESWQRNLGTRVRVVFVQANDYYAGLREQRGNLYEFGWIADYPHPHNFLDVLFHSTSADNIGKYRNAQVDDLLVRARTDPNDATSLDLYRRVNQLLLDDSAAIPLYYGRSHALVRPYVKGFQLTATGTAELRLVSLER